MGGMTLEVARHGVAALRRNTELSDAARRAIAGFLDEWISDLLTAKVPPGLGGEREAQCVSRADDPLPPASIITTACTGCDELDAARARIAEMEIDLKRWKRRARVCQDIVQEDHPDELRIAAGLRKWCARERRIRRKAQARVAEGKAVVDAEREHRAAERGLVTAIHGEGRVGEAVGRVECAHRTLQAALRRLDIGEDAAPVGAHRNRSSAGTDL